eukprot:5023143-Prymnesium_polylepis.1
MERSGFAVDHVLDVAEHLARLSLVLVPLTLRVCQPLRGELQLAAPAEALGHGVALVPDQRRKALLRCADRHAADHLEARREQLRLRVVAVDRAQVLGDLLDGEQALLVDGVPALA